MSEHGSAAEERSSSDTAPRSLRAFYDDVDLNCAPTAHRVTVLLRLLRAVPRPAGRPLRVLDVGCGDGEVAARMAAQPGVGPVVALDWARGAVRRARARGLVGVRAAADGAGLPFAGERFDVVAMSEVIEHLVDPDLALREARRVLAPGGTLLLSTPNLAAWFNRVLLVAGVQPVFSEVSREGVYGRPGSQVVGHLRLFTAPALREVLDAHGFAHVRLSGASYHDVPRVARPLDLLLARRPGLAAILLAAACRPGGAQAVAPGSGSGAPSP